MSDNTFVYVTYIKTTPEKLWEALTTPEFMNLYWFGSRFEMDTTVGGKIREFRPNDKPGFHGEILKSDPPNLLSYSFISSNEIETVVTFEIASAGETVSLTTTHIGYEKGSDMFNGISNGWSAILSGLKTFLESGKPLEEESTTELFHKKLAAVKSA